MGLLEYENGASKGIGAFFLSFFFEFTGLSYLCSGLHVGWCLVLCTYLVSDFYHCHVYLCLVFGEFHMGTYVLF